MSNNQIEHVNYTVTDPDKTAALLIAIFGWKIRWSGPSMNKGYTVHVGTDETYLALYAQKDATFSRFNHVAITVNDLDAAERRVLDYGLKSANHGDYAPGRRFYFYDPDGIEYEVVSYTQQSGIPSLSKGIDHVHIYAPDRADAAKWYARVFGFEPVESFLFWADDPRGPLTIADAANRIHLALFSRETFQTASLAFGASRKEYQAWKLRFNTLDLEFQEQSHDLAWSIYVIDPWGNHIEITTYEPL